jgi:hypothetical protein
VEGRTDQGTQNPVSTTTNQKLIDIDQFMKVRHGDVILNAAKLMPVWWRVDFVGTSQWSGKAQPN